MHTPGPPAPADRAAQRLGALPGAERAGLAAVLAAAPTPEHRAYILRALAAGHAIERVLAFATLVNRHEPGWLRAHLSLVDAARPGPVTVLGHRVRQCDRYTCGSTAIVVARAMADPLYALHLTGGDGPADPGRFAHRLAAEQARVHSATNVVWPKRLGTTPWGMRAAFDLHADAFGVRYRWRLARASAAARSALADAVTAVDAGHPVPVLIGGAIPRHYVLLVGRNAGDLLAYEPSRGSVVRVSESAFRAGVVEGLGFPRVRAVATPRPVRR